MRIQKTTLEYWALIAEIAGAIAIVVSVIYLGVQIRANTKVLRSRAHYNALSLAQRSFEMASIPGNICIIKTSTALFPSNSGSALTSSLKSWSRRNRDSDDSGPEYQYTLDHPFRSYVTNEFAKQKSDK